MMIPVSAHNKQKGFTLIETIIYIALFGILFTGIFISVYPLFTSAERLSENILVEGETAFILAKIRYALGDTITDSDFDMTILGGDEIEIENTDTGKLYHFRQGVPDTPCSNGGPALCSAIELKVGDDEFMPLSARRLNVTDFSVTHEEPNGELPRYLDISFSVNGKPMVPVRYYVRF